MAVPALWKVHVEPFHPLVAGHKIDVAPVQRVPYVKVTAGIWWWGVDAKAFARLVLGVEVVSVVLSPIIAPIGLLGGSVVALA